jgi:hypothetical protein
VRLGALQPGYLPWLGFFDQIDRSDVFVLYDDLPYSRHSWRNRNRIRTAEGWRWLTVPVAHHALSPTPIREIPISPDHDWRRQHWGAIRTSYGRSPYFADHAAFFARLYERTWRYLVDLDVEIIRYLVQALGIETRVVLSSEVGLERAYRSASAGLGRVEPVAGAGGGRPGDRAAGETDPTDRIAFISARMGADRFLEGALGRAYLDPARAADRGVILEFHDYPHPTYRQRFPPFIPYLSVIDLLFNHGPESRDILAGRLAIAVA